MTRVAPPFQAPVPPSLAPGAAASALLADLPPALRDLAQGAFLNGIVLDRNGNSGLTMLLTSSGVIGLKTTVPLPTGSTVMLQVQSAGAQIQAIVLSVTPQQPGGGVSLPPTMAPPASPAPSTQATAPVAVDGPVRTPSTITATVIGPVAAPPPPPAALVAPPVAAGNGPAAAHPAAETQKATPNPAPANQAPAGTTVEIDVESPALAAPKPAAIGVVHQQTAAYEKQMASAPLPASSPPRSAPPPAPAAPAAAAASPPATPPPNAPAPTPGPSAARAPVATATPPATPVPSPSLPAPLPSGAQIQVRLLAAEPYGQAPSEPSSAPPPPPAPVAATPAQSALPPRPALPLSAAPPTGSLEATIVAHTPAGQTVVDTAVGRLLLTLPKTLAMAALGSRLRFELVSADKPASPLPAAKPSGPSALAREWPTLKEALSAAQDAPDPEIHAALDRALPKAGPRLAQQIMSFVDAVSQGGSKAWLGDTVTRALEHASGGIIGRLDHDLKDMLVPPRGPDANWHLTIVPFLDGRELRQIRFFDRRKKSDGAKRRPEDPARFIIECDHSELGTMQIDGLMHEQRLDMILRSHDPLPAIMERDILVLFDQACVGLRIRGQLSFQAVANFPISPIDEFGDASVQVSV